MEIDFRVHPSGEYLMLRIEAPLNLHNEGEEDPAEILINKIAIQSYQNYTTSYPENPEYEVVVGESYFARRIDLDMIHKSGLYYLYIELSKDGEVCCPHDWDPFIIAAVDLHSLYNITINSLRSLDCDSCDSREYDRLLDLIVKHEIFERAVKIGDYATANELWYDILGYDWKKGRCRESSYSKDRTISCNTCR